jgi:hypothetical protein
LKKAEGMKLEERLENVEEVRRNKSVRRMRGK